METVKGLPPIYLVEVCQFLKIKNRKSLFLSPVCDTGYKSFLIPLTIPLIPISPKCAKNCQGIGITILYESESTYLYFLAKEIHRARCITEFKENMSRGRLRRGGNDAHQTRRNGDHSGKINTLCRQNTDNNVMFYQYLSLKISRLHLH